MTNEVDTKGSSVVSFAHRPNFRTRCSFARAGTWIYSSMPLTKTARKRAG